VRFERTPPPNAEAFFDHSLVTEYNDIVITDADGNYESARSPNHGKEKL